MKHDGDRGSTPPSAPGAPKGFGGAARSARAGRFDRFARDIGTAPMAELVQRVVDHHRLHLDIRQERLFAEWSAFVGDRVASRTRPDTIVDRTLIVEVATSTWLHELRLLRPKVVADLLDRLGMPRFFDDIRFVLAGERKRTPPTRAPRPRVPPTAPPPPMPATGAFAQRIVDDAARIADPELRALIVRVRTTHDR
jgi:hypothetical protein